MRKTSSANTNDFEHPNLTSGKVIRFMSEQAAKQIEVKQICYIDDSKTSAYVTKKLLTQEGYQVDHFANAESALEALMDFDYELLITDLMITAENGVNGDDLIRIIRHSGHPTKSQIPIVVVTGAKDAAVYDDLIAAGADKVLHKPIDAKMLHHAIQALAPNISVASAETVEQATEESESYIEPLSSFSDSDLPDFDNRVKFEESALSKSSISTKQAKVLSQPSAASAAASSSVKKQVKKQAASNADDQALDIPVLTSVVNGASTNKSDRTERKKKKAMQKSARNKSHVTQPDSEKPVSSSAFQDNISSADIKQSETARKTEIEVNQSNVSLIDEISQQYDNEAFMPAKSESKSTSKSAAAQSAQTEDSSEILPPTMFDSIRQELEKMSIPQKAGKASGVAPVNGLNTSPTQETVTPVTAVTAPVASTVASAKPEISQPAVSPSANIPANAQDNPLLSLLDHMDKTGEVPQFQKSAKTVSFKPNKALTKGLFGILFIMIITAAVFWYLGQRPITVNVVQVEQGPIHSEISVPGRVVSKRNIRMGARAAGQIVKVAIKENDKVKEGDLLAKMDDKEAVSNVKRAQARLMSTQEEVANLSKTQERLQRALDVGAVSRQVVEDAEAAWKAASAKQSIIEEELVAAELKLDRLQIKAPFDGLVTGVHVQEGQWLSVAEPIVTLVDMNQREVEIRVDVSDSARLNVGQTVMLSTEAFPGKTWEEKIVKIGSEAQTENSANVIRVNTSLGSKAPSMRIGQQVDAEIRVTSRNNALILPYNVMFTHNGESTVATIENGKIVFLPVATGVESVTHIEILRGLRAGQEVVVPAGLPLTQGMNAVAAKNN